MSTIYMPPPDQDGGILASPAATRPISQRDWVDHRQPSWLVDGLPAIPERAVADDSRVLAVVSVDDAVIDRLRRETRACRSRSGGGEEDDHV